MVVLVVVFAVVFFFVFHLITWTWSPDQWCMLWHWVNAHCHQGDLNCHRVPLNRYSTKRATQNPNCFWAECMCTCIGQNNTRRGRLELTHWVFSTVTRCRPLVTDQHNCVFRIVTRRTDCRKCEENGHKLGPHFIPTQTYLEDFWQKTWTKCVVRLHLFSCYPFSFAKVLIDKKLCANLRLKHSVKPIVNRQGRFCLITFLVR